MNPLFRSTAKMSSALDFHRQRHSVLAGNVANVDTPDFRPIDIQRTALSLSSDAESGDMQLSATDGVNFFFDDEDSAPNMDGNTVNLERELAKVDANRVRYNATSRLVSKRLATLRYAATDGVG